MTQTVHLVSQNSWSHNFTSSNINISNYRLKRTVGRVVNGGDDTRGKDNLLPCLANVDNIDTIGPGLPQVRLHVYLKVLSAEMALSSQEHLNVLLGGVEDRGKVAGSHLDGLALQKLVGVVRLSRYSRSNFFGGERRLAIFACGTLACSGAAKGFADSWLGRAEVLEHLSRSSVVHRHHAASNTRIIVPSGSDTYVIIMYTLVLS